MSDLGLLMFNLEENEGILRNARALSKAVEEIVVVDSSSPQTRKELVRGLEPLRGRVVPVVPVGFVYPLRSFGVAQMTSDRVLLLDADEEVSSPLRDALPVLRDADAYVLPRLEVELGSYTYHLRLFRREAVRFRGRSYDFPAVRGSVAHLDRPRCIVHRADYRSYFQDKGRAERYFSVENVERPFLRAYLHDALTVRLGGRGVSWPGTGWVATPPDAAMSPPLVHLAIEYEFLRDILLGKGLRAARFNRRYSVQKWRFFDTLPREDQERMRRVAAAVQHAGGLLEYLQLYDPAYLAGLTASYGWDRRGIDVLRELLAYRYQNGRPMESFHGG